MTAGRVRGQRAEVVVDVAAIRHNARVLREVAGVPLIAVVKADGYGHGMLESARAAREGGAEWLAVATVGEALALREGGDRGRLLCWLTDPGVTDPADPEGPLARAVRADVDLTAYSVDELDDLAAAAAAVGVRARVQLKVDTGLSRGGAPAAEWPALFARAGDGQRGGRWTLTGLWSHLACADQPDHPANAAQRAAFEHALALAAEAGLDPGLRHLANSAGALLLPDARYDAVRCGIALYGLDPAPGATPDALRARLRPAMTARAPLALVKPVDAGASVSYGHTWTAPAPTTVGLVPVGYGDGVPRHASSGGPGPDAEVLVAGRRRPVRGRVCMDQVLVDLDGDHPPPGTDAVLFGPADPSDPTGPAAPTAQEWAEACGTISYEIVTRMGSARMPRRHVDSDTATAATGSSESTGATGAVASR